MCGHLFRPGGRNLWHWESEYLTKIMPPVRGYLQSLRRRVQGTITTTELRARGHAATRRRPPLKWPRVIFLPPLAQLDRA